jgi:hypothetical protein
LRTGREKKKQKLALRLSKHTIVKIPLQEYITKNTGVTEMVAILHKLGRLCPLGLSRERKHVRLEDVAQH